MLSCKSNYEMRREKRATTPLPYRYTSVGGVLKTFAIYQFSESHVSHNCWLSSGTAPLQGLCKPGLERVKKSYPCLCRLVRAWGCVANLTANPGPHRPLCRTCTRHQQAMVSGPGQLPAAFSRRPALPGCDWPNSSSQENPVAGKLPAGCQCCHTELQRVVCHHTSEQRRVYRAEVQ